MSRWTTSTAATSLMVRSCVRSPRYAALSCRVIPTQGVEPATTGADKISRPKAVRVRVRAEPGLSEADAAALLLLYGRARHPDAYLDVVTPVVRADDAHLAGVILARARALNPDAYLDVVIPSTRANDAHDIDELTTDRCL